MRAKYEFNNGGIEVVTSYRRGEKRFNRSSMIVEDGCIHGLRVNDINADPDDFINSCFTKEIGEKYGLSKKGFEATQLVIMHQFADIAMKQMYDKSLVTESNDEV